MAKNVTLVNEDKNPAEVTTSDPTHITQLKSEGYKVKDDAEKAPAKTTASSEKSGSTK